MSWNDGGSSDLFAGLRYFLYSVFFFLRFLRKFLCFWYWKSGTIFLCFHFTAIFFSFSYGSLEEKMKDLFYFLAVYIYIFLMILIKFF